MSGDVGSTTILLYIRDILNSQKPPKVLAGDQEEPILESGHTISNPSSAT